MSVYYHAFKIVTGGVSTVKSVKALVDNCSQHLYFRNPDGDIFALVWRQEGWSLLNITHLCRVKTNAACTPVSYCSGSGYEYVFFYTVDGRLLQLKSLLKADTKSSSKWEVLDLTDHLGLVLEPEGELVCWTTLGGSFHLFVNDRSGHVHEIWWTAAGWRHTDVTVKAFAPLSLVSTGHETQEELSSSTESEVQTWQLLGGPAQPLPAAAYSRVQAQQELRKWKTGLDSLLRQERALEASFNEAMLAGKPEATLHGLQRSLDSVIQLKENFLRENKANVWQFLRVLGYLNGSICGSAGLGGGSHNIYLFAADGRLMQLRYGSGWASAHKDEQHEQLEAAAASDNNNVSFASSHPSSSSSSRAAAALRAGPAVDPPLHSDLLRVSPNASPRAEHRDPDSPSLLSRVAGLFDRPRSAERADVDAGPGPQQPPPPPPEEPAAPSWGAKLVEMLTWGGQLALSGGHLVMNTLHAVSTSVTSAIPSWTAVSLADYSPGLQKAFSAGIVPIGAPTSHCSSNGTLNVFFVAYPDMHLHHVYWSPTSRVWAYQDITAAIMCVPVLETSRNVVLSIGVGLFYDFVHYIDSAGHIHELSKPIRDSLWRDCDVQQQVMPELPLAAELLTSSTLPLNKEFYATVVYYRDRSDHVIELIAKWQLMPPFAQQWAFNDLYLDRHLLSSPPPVGRVSLVQHGLVESVSLTARHSLDSAVSFVHGVVARTGLVNPPATDGADEEISEQERVLQQISRRLQEKDEKLRAKNEDNEKLQIQIIELEDQQKQMQHSKSESAMLQQRLNNLHAELESNQVTLQRELDEREVLRQQEAAQRALIEAELSETKRQVSEMQRQLAEAEAAVEATRQYCVICMSNEQTVAVRPCFHACLCRDCYRTYPPQRCPMCRGPVEGFQEIFHA